VSFLTAHWCLKYSSQHDHTPDILTLLVTFWCRNLAATLPFFSFFAYFAFFSLFSLFSLFSFICIIPTFAKLRMSLGIVDGDDELDGLVDGAAEGYEETEGSLPSTKITGARREKSFFVLLPFGATTC
jgi:hypothetical protein